MIEIENYKKQIYQLKIPPINKISSSTQKRLNTNFKSFLHVDKKRVSRHNC